MNDITVGGKLKFIVGDYSRGGYPVLIDGCSWHVAEFTQEDEAKD